MGLLPDIGVGAPGTGPGGIGSTQDASTTTDSSTRITSNTQTNTQAQGDLGNLVNLSNTSAPISLNLTDLGAIKAGSALAGQGLDTAMVAVTRAYEVSKFALDRATDIYENKTQDKGQEATKSFLVAGVAIAVAAVVAVAFIFNPGRKGAKQ